MRNLARIFGITLLAFVVHACEIAPSRTFPDTSGDARRPDLTEWREIHVATQSAQGRTTMHVGFLRKDIRGDDFTYTILDRRDMPVGFALPDTQTFRFVRKYDSNGKPYQTTEYIGNVGIERAVLRVLRVTADEAELRPITSRMRASAVAAESSTTPAGAATTDQADGADDADGADSPLDALDGFDLGDPDAE